ncbi:MAG: hypothetical protein RI918_1135 [Pseudomonadota bacterium]|jgi:hypothetical protein
MKKTSKFLICAVVSLAATAHAQNIRPGQYDYAVTSEMFGMKIPINFKQCVTQKDVESNNAYVNQKGAEGCSTPVVQRDGSNIAIKYTCISPKMTGEGRGTIGADSFTINMNVIQHDMGNSVVKTQVAAKRLGDC